MSSIFRDALGDAFEKLHPKMQWRFGFSSENGTAQVGHGVMDEVWRGPFWTLPFLLLGSTRRVLFPSRGRDVPFTIENYAYRDSWPRDRHVRSPVPHEESVPAFDATMVVSPQRGTIVDYLGTHQHLAVVLHVSVDEVGGLRLRSSAQRFYEGPIGFRFPLLLSGVATVREWWDEADQRFHIEVDVRNRYFGPLFGYSGSFTVDERPCTHDQIPIDVLPLREERRE